MDYTKIWRDRSDIFFTKSKDVQFNIGTCHRRRCTSLRWPAIWRSNIQSAIFRKFICDYFANDDRHDTNYYYHQTGNYIGAFKWHIWIRPWPIWWLPSKDNVAKIVLYDLDLLFEGKTFETLIPETVRTNVKCI